MEHRDGNRDDGGFVPRTGNSENLPRGRRGSFLLGSTFAYLRDPMGFVAQAKRDHGDVVWLRLGNLRTYLVSHPEQIEYVLRTHADNFMKDKLTRWLIPLVGEGLLTSEGTLGDGNADWRSRPSSTSRSNAMPRSWSSRPSACYGPGRTARSATRTRI